MEQKRSLVEQEGVNAGSAEASEDRDVPPGPAASRAGGRPEGAAEQPRSDLDDESGGGSMAGAPPDRRPGTEEGSSGQDAGSME